MNDFSIVCSSILLTVVVVQLLSCVWLFATLWTAACQASPSFTIFQSLLKLMPIELVMPSNHLILCCPLLLLPSIFPSIRVFSNESTFPIRWPKYRSFMFSISPSNDYSGLISFRIDWFDSWLSRVFSNTKFESKLILWCLAFFIVPYIHMWLLEKPYLWLYEPLSAKWCLCFLIRHLGLS